MNIELSDKEFRRLLDMVYIGNWILNSARGEDRFEDYDQLQEKMFSLAPQHGMNSLVQRWYGHIFPSQAYEDGGIHEAIADYEDAVFFNILAEELARRDLGLEDCEPEDYTELSARMEEYMQEFRRSAPTPRRTSACAPGSASGASTAGASCRSWRARWTTPPSPPSASSRTTTT